MRRVVTRVASPSAGATDDMITIDGSTGEGGGQVLRTALALSLVTGAPFRIEKIRAGRPKPGLLRQHLTAVKAAAAVGKAQVSGDVLGASELTFEPGAVTAGEYAFAIGSAGSATLVLQTVLPALLTASVSSTLTLDGGTHNPWAPPFDFLRAALLPIVNQLGPRVEAELVKPGFYPAGGGRIVVTIAPAKALARLDLDARGDVLQKRVRVLLANLPKHIADRELRTALRLLNWPPECAGVEQVDASDGPGNVMFVVLESARVTEVFTGFGESGTAAEAVAEGVAKAARRYLAADVPVGPHLADQLLPIMAVGQGGSFRTVSLTRHARTAIEVIRRFLDVEISAASEARDVTRVEVRR
jgi:RNA 3'-terminal phosphate cyclase (ATP)